MSFFIQLSESRPADFGLNVVYKIDTLHLSPNHQCYLAFKRNEYCPEYFKVFCLTTHDPFKMESLVTELDAVKPGTQDEFRLVLDEDNGSGEIVYGSFYISDDLSKVHCTYIKHEKL